MSQVRDAASFISSLSPVAPRVGVILGSGLGTVAEGIEDPVKIPYAQIPGFPCTTVPGHQGELAIGTMEGVGIAAMKGRPHLYEGYTPAQIGFPVRVFHALGVRLLVVTNAAGGMRPDLERGTLMVLEDHINLPGLGGLNPLVGAEDGVRRFVEMSTAYDEGLRLLVLEAARERGLRAASGVYAMVVGPSYETPAEARLLRQLGADAVGMSTAPEVVVARSLRMRVVGISCITNVLLQPQHHGEGGHLGVVSVAEMAAPDLASLLRTVLHHSRGMSDESRS